MKILIIGGGAREHALAWRLRQSQSVSEIICAPGNPGIAKLARCFDVAINDIDGLVALASSERIDLVVVGPEAPLVAGVADRLAEAGIAVFGPSAAAARLEGSKRFAKEFMARHGIPTAAFGAFTEPAPARAFLDQLQPPFVLKADGLAAGKGVVIAESRAEAEREIDAMLAGRHGAASSTLVIEAFLSGEEASFFALCDGETAVALGGAQDHKRVGEGDTGPNTGGMGAYSPAPVLTAAVERRVMEEIVWPTLRGMKAEGAPYRGVLFVGLMIEDGSASVVEFNCRFGDPECEVLMARLEGDLAPLLLACASGSLGALAPPTMSDRRAATVVLAARGYPGEPAKGGVIRLGAAASRPAVEIFHAGTAMREGEIIADGGRVLAVSATGDTLRSALEQAYAAVDEIEWADGFCRRDIGWRALGRGET